MTRIVTKFNINSLPPSLPPSLRDKNRSSNPRVERDRDREEERACKRDIGREMEPARMRETYRECMRNHAARLGTYACDGCCEYSPDTLHPNVLFCTACGCHRNFHRKVSPNSPAGACAINVRVGTAMDILRARRRKRSKFTAEQKALMGAFAARIGWKVRKQDTGGEDEVSSFCKDVGITRQIFKIWIHNHKGSASAATSTSHTNAAPTRVEGEGDHGGCEGGEGEEEVKGSASMEGEK